MDFTTEEMTRELKVSKLAENLVGSEIIKIANDINEKISKGEKIYNLTIGDFNPNIFSIPEELKEEIIKAYTSNQTNYPKANGIDDLRGAVGKFINKYQPQLNYTPDQILISAGARPLIYGTYLALVDEGDTVVFPVPSWNNNHYNYLMKGNAVVLETSADNYFMPTADELRPHIGNATLIALCSPLNPTGTMFTKKDLEEICDMILAENKRRSADDKPLYLMYDQIYSALALGENKHHDPVSLRPEMKDYTIFIDGISKGFSATGVRVGWAFGPDKVIAKMRSILSHIGAWAPKAEQVATANYLKNEAAVDTYLGNMKEMVETRLAGFYNGFELLKQEGFAVDAIAPQGAIYLTVRFSLHGYKTAEGKTLVSTADITKYLLDEAKVGLVPFYAFGTSKESSWYRLSIGTCKVEDIDEIIASLRNALKKLVS